MRLSRFLLLALPFAGCDEAAESTPVDADGDGLSASDDCDDGDASVGAPSDWYADLDGDAFGSPNIIATECEQPSGYLSDNTDCSSEDADIYPGAPESCNGVDDDCNGVVDNDAVDAPAWYPDVDGDGFGDPSAPVYGCDAPAGAVADSTDCDDGDPAIAPGLPEYCNDADDDCDGSTDEDAVDALSFYPDADADGYGDGSAPILSCSLPDGATADATDCDDTNPAVHPGGTEVCGGGDEDCDGYTDDEDPDVEDSAPLWYADVDGDTYGNMNVPEGECVQPDGFVANPADCDDTRATSYPGAAESCDKRDEDCDGVVDNHAVDALPWYLDRDLDGYGDVATVFMDCEAPTDYIADGTDCDDTDITVNPGASELCAVGDEDCDGLDGDADPSVSDAPEWYVDSDGDSFGDSASVVVACTVTGYVERDEDCDDTDTTVHPEASEVCEDGIDQDCLGGDQSCAVEGEWGLSSSDATFTAAAGYMGISVSPASDVDGDGLPDLIFGAPTYDGGGVDSGAAFVMKAPYTDTVDADVNGVLLLGIHDGDAAGTAVAGVGDLDGDGLGDLIVGAQNVSPNETGETYLVYGSSLPSTGSMSLSSADARFPGISEWADSGETLCAAGDLNADGVSDFLIGAPADRTGAYHAGSIIAVFGANYSGDVDLTSMVMVVGIKSGQHVAGWMDSAGDMNGDGMDDVIIGGEGADSPDIHAGAAYILLGPIDAMASVDDGEVILEGEDTLDEAGTGVGGAGDTNADGYADVLVGAPANARGGFGAGTAYLNYGPLSGVKNLASSDAIIVGATGGAQAGYAVDGPGDVDADGYDDVMVGSPRDSTIGHYGGAAYVVYGPVAASLSLADADAHMVGSGGAGSAVSGAGDLDSDGYLDMLIGAPGYGLGGRVWLVYGRTR